MLQWLFRISLCWVGINLCGHKFPNEVKMRSYWSQNGYCLKVRYVNTAKECGLDLMMELPQCLMRLHSEFLVSLKSDKIKMQFAYFNNEDDIFVFILLGIIQNWNFLKFPVKIFLMIRKLYFCFLYQTFRWWLFGIFGRVFGRAILVKNILVK